MPLSSDFSHDCSTLFAFTRTILILFKTFSPFEPRLGPVNSPAPFATFPSKNVDAPLIIREHSVPALIIVAVSKHVLARMALATIPAFYDQAFIEFDVDSAVGAARHPRICHRQSPNQKSICRLSRFAEHASDPVAPSADGTVTQEHPTTTTNRSVLNHSEIRGLLIFSSLHATLDLRPCCAEAKRPS